MKRILSLVMTLAMILSLCAILAACGDKDKPADKPLGDPTKDPTVLPEVYANTAAAFLGDSALADATLTKALQSGSLDIHFALEDVGGAPLAIRETLYSDAEGGKLVSETLLSLMGEELSATVWGAPGVLSIASESILGTKTAYSVNLSTLVSGLKGSALAETLEIPDEILDELISMLEKLNTPAGGNTAGETEVETTAADAFVASLPDKLQGMTHMSAESLTVTNGEGEDQTSTEYLVVTYTINNDSMEQLLDLIADAAIVIAGDKATDKDTTELLDTMTKIMEDFNKEMEFEIVEKIHILKKEKVVEKTELTLSITPKEEGVSQDPLNGTFITTFSSTRIAMDLELSVPESNTVKGTLTVDKKVEGDLTTYTIAVNGGTKNVTADVLTATLTYNKTSGELKLAGDLIADESDRIAFSAAATYKVSTEELSFTMNSVAFADKTFTFNDKNVLAITAKATAEMPASPADAKDIVTLNEDEVTSLIEGIMESPLGQLISSSASPVLPEGMTVHELDGFLLPVPEDMEEVNAGEQYTAAFENDNAGILILKETHRSCEAAGIESLADYIRAVAKNNGVATSKLETIGDLEYFEFTADNGFTYLITAYDLGDAYWGIYYLSDVKSYEDYRPLFLSSVQFLPTANETLSVPVGGGN